MAALTTLFTPPSWCANRFAVFADDQAPGTSIIPPSSGWVDPSFTKCIPTQYTTPHPTFSPGVCPVNMQIVKYAFDVHDGKTVWEAGCCQSGFSPLSFDPNYLCTSSITSPMAFLLDPEISTADVYTTLAPELWIEHDQVTVQWELSDLGLFPLDVASQYKLMMGMATSPETPTSVPTTTTVSWPTKTASPTSTTVLWPTTTAPQTSNSVLSTTTITQPSTSSISTSETQPSATTTNNGKLHDISGSVTIAFILFAIAMFFLA